MRTLTLEEARRFYDRIGARQDSQAYYEDPANDALIESAELRAAERVFELGCGTGRLAERLLSSCLADSASYRGIDLSTTMVGLAEQRLGRFGPRAEVSISDGQPPAREPATHYDRWISTFVLDLLPAPLIDQMIVQAHRMLVPGGRLCLAGLSHGTGLGSRIVERLWSAVHRMQPALVGGCRPVALRQHLEPHHWKLLHHERLAPYCIPLEVVTVARI